MTKYCLEFCTRKDKSAWCKRIKRELTGGFNPVFLGVFGCYQPGEDTICLGREMAVNARMHNEEDETIRLLIDVICHEEDHRAIYEATGSKKATLKFDYLFTGLFNFKENRQYFRRGDIDIFGELTSWGKMVEKKLDDKFAQENLKVLVK